MKVNQSVYYGHDLSVVIITRNEEAHIEKCLRAVIAAADEVGGAEIIVVDSASTDRTVAIARSLDVRVVSLRPEWELSASAGRYIGFHHTSGELIMFVDADTLIDRLWFPAALQAFSQHEDVAAVTGWLDDEDECGKRLTYVGRRIEQVTEVGTLRGIGMYRRQAMREAGTFNPWLLCEEEAELALRLRGQGWKLLKLPSQMGCHTRGAEQGKEILRHLRQGRPKGDGKTLLYALAAGNGLKFVVGRLLSTLIFTLTFMTILLTGVGLRLVGFNWGWLVSALMFIAWTTAVAMRKKNINGVLAYFLKHTAVSLGVVLGLLTSTVRAAGDYPLNVIEENLFICQTML